MNILDINEAIYASSNGVVVERRKSMIVPILVLLAGLALLVVNYIIDNGDDANNLKSVLVLMGGVASVLGAALCGIRIFGTGGPYHKQDKCYLICKQYSFSREQETEVLRIVNNNDKEALDKVEESNVMALLVLCYYSPKGSFVAMQAFGYSDFTYNPITEVKIKS